MNRKQALRYRPYPLMAGSSAARRTVALIGALTLLVGALALCADRTHTGDVYLQLLTGRFITAHGLVSYDPFPTIAHGQPWLNQQWLAELAFYRVARGIGLTGLTVIYALLLALPLAFLLWSCRAKGRAMLFAIVALYFPGLLAVVHPRAEGFTVLAFSLLVALILAAWGALAREGRGSLRLRLALISIPLLFAIWANVHAGFIGGFLLIALVTLGMAIDRRRGLVDAVSSHRVALLGLSGILAAAAVTLATPLGGEIWSYVLSFRNPAISLVTREWAPAISSIPDMVYLALAATFAGWLWWHAPSPRKAMPILVTGGFVVFAVLSFRNIIFVAPVLALQIAISAPNRSLIPSRILIAVAGCAAALAAGYWATVLGPPRAQGEMGSSVVAYALRHPPRAGRIAVYPGVGSYILWRSPSTPVVLDGWIEHFTPAEVRHTYAIILGWRRNPMPYVRRLGIGAAIAHTPSAIRALRAHGFVVRFSTGFGTYLTRRSKPAAGPPIQ